MQQININQYINLKAEKYILQNVQLTLILPNFSLGNRALSPSTSIIRSSNLGTVDLQSTFDIMSDLPYQTSLDIFDMYSVHRLSHRRYQRSLSRSNIDLHTISKIQSFYIKCSHHQTLRESTMRNSHTISKIQSFIIIGS